MKVSTKWLPLFESMKNNLGYWLGNPSGKAAFHSSSDLRWLSFQGLEVRPFEARRSKCGKIIGDE